MLMGKNFDVATDGFVTHHTAKNIRNYGWKCDNILFDAYALKLRLSCKNIIRVYIVSCLYSLFMIIEL